MEDFWRDFWIRETGTGQQVAQLHDRYVDDDDDKHFTICFLLDITEYVISKT